MKKVLCLIVVMLIASSLLTFDNSKTMDLTELRNAVETEDGSFDEVMYSYWQRFADVGDMPTSRFEGDDDDMREERASYDNIDYADDYDSRYPDQFSHSTNNHRMFVAASLGYAVCVCIYFLT